MEIEELSKKLREDEIKMKNDTVIELQLYIM